MLDRLGEAAQPFLDAGLHDQGHREMWIDLERSAHLGERLVELVGLIVGPCEIVIVDERERIELDRAPRLGDRLLVAPGGAKQHVVDEVRPRIAGVEPEGLLHLLLGPGPVAVVPAGDDEHRALDPLVAGTE